MAFYQDAWGLQYEEVMTLCWLAYKGCGAKGLYKFSNGSTWEITDVIEIGDFRAVVVKGKDKTVLSFSGTDLTSIEDWLNNFLQGGTGFSPYYAYALDIARKYPADVVVGHSLGGGLASYCAIYSGKKAATINAAPLNINLVSAIPIFRNSNLVINYVAAGEALDLFDTVASSMTKIGRIISVATTGPTPVHKHLLDYLVGFAKPALMAPGTPKPYLPPTGGYPPAPDRPGYIPRIHVVKQGDWLSKIAITYYGDMNKWDVIYKRNIDTIGKDPNLIIPGQRLVIP
ncbi:MAG TPA: LysM peptidoglycan-binding domain-containing protein [Pyrinomonadaceae bacterium]|jgi:hypothetical protein|nr:LysM peptidoglycan-binding domain-containing protein [Pyrinomonadaceae bacterium]